MFIRIIRFAESTDGAVGASIADKSDGKRTFPPLSPVRVFAVLDL